MCVDWYSVLGMAFERTLGDDAPKRLGTGWASGVTSVFLGALALGAVLVLRHPEWLSTAQFRELYPLAMIRALSPEV